MKKKTIKKVRAVMAKAKEVRVADLQKTIAAVNAIVDRGEAIRAELVAAGHTIEAATEHAVRQLQAEHESR